MDESILEIEHVTEKLLADIDFSQSPAVDIASLVKKDGFDVKPSLMPIETTGCLFVNDTSEEPERLIMVNKVFKNPENEDDVVFKKSRFITAHEYGHYRLHKSPQQPLYAHRDSDKREEIQKKEADYFARSLLMPYEQFKSYTDILRSIANDEDFTISMLSKLFKVTKNTVIAIPIAITKYLFSTKEDKTLRILFCILRNMILPGGNGRWISKKLQMR